MYKRKWLVLAAIGVGVGLNLFLSGCSTTLLTRDITNSDYTQLGLAVPLNQPPTNNQRLTQRFGADLDAKNKGHLGEDYGAVVPGVAGDPIYAIRAGRVTISELRGTGDRTCVNPRTGRTGWGNLVVIEHPYPKSLAPGGFLYSIYAHLDTRLVNVGDRVTEGQRIGTMGCTGFATGIHLHIGLVDRDAPGLGYLGYNFNQDRVTDRTGRAYYRPSLFFSSPTSRIDGGVWSMRPQGSTFIFTGSGYTPRGSVSLRLRQPNGSEVTLPSIKADATGSISWGFRTSCSTPVGTYIVWAIDDTTGRGWFWSNHLEMIVTRGLCRI